MYRCLLFTLIWMIFLCSGCSSFRFVKDGYFVDEVDEYFNPKHKYNVWVYYDFMRATDDKVGVRLDKLYPEDRTILELFGLSRFRTKVLFTALPSKGMRYHLVAAFNKISSVDTSMYKRVDHDKTHYYIRDTAIKNIDARHVLIPTSKTKALSFVYYTAQEEHESCKFCKIEYLARINAEEQQVRKSYSNVWQIFDCEEKELKSVKYKPDLNVLSVRDRMMIKIYADYTSSKGISYFKIIEKGDTSTLNLKLCKNNYIIHYFDKKSNLLHVDSLMVD